MVKTLPQSDNLNVAALTKIFLNTTNSYKHLFFQSILNLIQENKSENTFNLREICCGMLRIAYAPQKYYCLSLGRRDKIGRAIDSIFYEPDVDFSTVISINKNLQRKIEENFDESWIGTGKSSLTRYVSYRIQTPFFASELRGLKDAEKNSTIESCAQRAFTSESPPIFRYVDGDRIEINEKWMDYFSRSTNIISSWAKYHWIEYLQRRNPNVPSIITKIELPISRGNLTRQRNYWDAIIGETDIRCIYTNEMLNKGDYALDHYIPWSFVCHDQLWNLVPVLPEANSSKSNSLPSKKYLINFKNCQFTGLQTSYQLYGDNWEKKIEAFVTGLRLTPNQLLEKRQFVKTIDNVVSPLISIASQNGFESDWVF